MKSFDKAFKSVIDDESIKNPNEKTGYLKTELFEDLVRDIAFNTMKNIGLPISRESIQPQQEEKFNKICSALHTIFHVGVLTGKAMNTERPN